MPYDLLLNFLLTLVLQHNEYCIHPHPVGYSIAEHQFKLWLNGFLG